MPNDEQVPPQNTDKDMQIPGDEYVNMEGESHSTAAEGSLITPEDDSKQLKNIPAELKNNSPAPPDGTIKTTLKQDETQDPDKISG